MHFVDSVVTAIGALAALAAVGIAVVQFRHSRIALGIDTVRRFEEAFDAPLMQDMRRQAARAIQTSTNGTDIEPVLDFFESIGLVVRRKIVPADVAWGSFCYWVLRYAILGASQVAARRKAESDDTYYEDFDYLVKRIMQVECKKRRLAVLPAFSKAQLDAFLEEEVAE